MLKDFKLQLVNPEFGSNLTKLIFELDHLRKKSLDGSTHPQVFFQLKHIFHTLESIGSARIEGNNTTIAEYIETKLEENESPKGQDIVEIQNIEKAMTFIDENVEEYNINRMFISEMHKQVVDDLTPPPNGEGDHSPGEYRTTNVKIAQSDRTPPDWLKVDECMDELFHFIAKEDEPQYDLLKVALAHHRFVWVHPFGNGNGRTVRMLTYALLAKLGFNVNVGRILNPTAVFCNNRDHYYQYLSGADTGSKEGLLSWCEYVLGGLRDEINKIDKLLDYKYLKSKILIPAINYSAERGVVTTLESKILKKVVEKQEIQAGDLGDIFTGKVPAEVSRQIKKLTNKKMLVPTREGKRKYVLRFDNNYLLRGVINALGDNGFLPIQNE